MKLFKKKKEPREEFTADLAETESFKSMLKVQKCPGCGQMKLVLRSFERGPEGFEAKVGCTNCSAFGVVNQLGFHFVGLSKGVAAPLPIRTG
jgi:hypothetical protein